MDDSSLACNQAQSSEQSHTLHTSHSMSSTLRTTQSWRRRIKGITLGGLRQLRSAWRLEELAHEGLEWHSGHVVSQLLNSTTACKALTICMQALAHRSTNLFTWPCEGSLLNSLGETTWMLEVLGY